MNDTPQDDLSVDSEEEEQECRVCRGPAEEGRPLYSPCRCSGSIGLTHQDCLTSWLSVTRGDGQCELCGTKFRFKPKYVDGAPERLPPHEVFLGLCSRFAAKWLPFTLRCILVACVWLGVAPLATAYLYHGWMHRPASILKRLRWKLVPGDIVSGLVIAAIIIVSFLSFMSFADFLRFNWHHENLGGGGVRNRQRQDPPLVEEENDVDEEYVLDDIIDHIARQQAENDGELSEATTVQQSEQRRVRWSDEGNDRLLANVWRPPPEEEELDDNDAAVDAQEGENAGEPEADRAAMIEMLDRPARVEELDDIVRRRIQAHQERRAREDRFEPQFEPLDPVPMIPEDDAGDVEMNVPLDELLGLRGPLNILVRNLLWLLAFNTSYLGIFAFLPKSFGSSLNALVFNSTTTADWAKHVPFLYSENANVTTLSSIMSSINNESDRLETTIKLPDLSLLILGYFMFGLGVLSMQAGIYVYKLVRMRRRQRNASHHRRRDERQREVNANFVFADENVDGAPRAPALPHPRLHGEDADNGSVGEYLSIALDCLKALVKVTFLLFVKMLLLPLVLGIWLDIATLQLLGGTGMDRILYAGGDLFSSALLHWVAGITFMLLVTVSVLQLREVVHPDLMAPLIRPQEPQPDLIGNLLHESASTHTRRMFLSFIIYAYLLTVHVWIPTQFLAKVGISQYLPFADLHFWHVLMPQLQVPLELLLFHLTMLAVLEKCKNQIGAVQHRWLVFMSDLLGLSDQLIPKTVAKFQLAGSRPVLVPSATADGAVDPFWYELAAYHGDVNTFITSHITHKAGEEDPTYLIGRSQSNGEVRLGYDKHIRLPKPARSVSGRSAEESRRGKYLLSTSIGAYRLVPRETEDKQLVIEFWREVPGDPIPRPPEGWDDLGIGGADVQGRWAWGREKKSAIERGVAKRKPFFGQSSRLARAVITIKVLLLVAFSWLACTVAVFAGLAAPLISGRVLLFILRIRKEYSHDPLAFVMGAIVCMFCHAFASNLYRARVPLLRMLLSLVSRLRLPPPIRKASILFYATFLWAVAIPMAIGTLYELLFVDSRNSFLLGWPIIFTQRGIMSWATGSLLLNTWALLCFADVFTRGFWQNIGDAPADGDENPRQGRQNLDGWQGENGRLHRFVRIYVKVITGWEWDTVNHHELLTDCTVPILTEVLKSLIGSLIAWQIWLFWMSFAFGFPDKEITLRFVGVLNWGVVSMVVYRFLCVCTILMQLANANRQALQKWFNAAHKAARDGRYLEGEVLINYGDNTTQE